MENRFTKAFWEDRYLKNNTGWDIGNASTPLISYINQLNNKDLKILIPGAGNSHEAEFLFEQGFKNVFIIDISSIALGNFKKRYPNFPKEHIINGDFFEHSEKYDLILEQTFFCALDPFLRKQYVDKMYNLLNVKGKLVGVLFNFELTNQGPPFGGSLNEYLEIFSKKFTIKYLENCENSIKPRLGRELFFNFEKK